jgi:NAD(P)-dependent dehydrogenase (short-subunit alcohol dehydrogenase family)
MQLNGKVALVTGGASGIGAGVARRLAASGVRVVIADVDVAGGEAVAADVGGFFVRTDVSLLDDNEAVVAVAVDRFGRLDILVLNAGVGEGGSFVDDFQLDRYRKVRAINLDGVVYGLHAALGALTEQGGGTVIVTSSLAGLFESPFSPIYAATKHAVIGLVRSLGPVLAEKGITINAMCPTFVDTPILGDALPYLVDAGMAVLDVERVADAVEAIIADGGTGQVWTVLPHDDPAPFVFPGVPNLMASVSHDDAAAPQ